MKTKNQNIIGAVLVVLIVSLVPLVVSAFKYETGMAEYAWFSSSTVRYDFFLFWKGQLLLLLCALMAFYAALKCLLVKEGMPDSKLEKKYIIPLALYAVLAFESTIFSKHTDAAVRGGYEQDSAGGGGTPHRRIRTACRSVCYDTDWWNAGVWI